jgi:hypothetical protein
MSRLGFRWLFARLISFLLDKIARAVPSTLLGWASLKRSSALAGIVVKLRNYFFPSVIATAPLWARLMI